MKFFINSANAGYLRNLAEEFGESTNGIRLELNRFEQAGFLESFSEGNKKLFKANVKHPFFSEINKIILKTTGIEYVLDYVIGRIGDLDAVYLTGNLAKGQVSDVIDLILVGGELNKVFLFEQIEKAERKIDKKIKFIHFKRGDFEEKKVIESEVHKPLLLWSKKK